MTLITHPLFDIDEPPPLAARLAPRLRALAGRGVFFGASSWKYQGWIGSIYSRHRYLNRQKFSIKKFETECLAEYAQTFPVVGGDFSFYQIPSSAYWDRLFSGIPKTFAIGLKVPEHFTVRMWPSHSRYGKLAGTFNEQFLDSRYFAEAFLRPLLPHRDQVATVMFEFGAFARSILRGVDEFLKLLGPFLAALPSGWRYAVEIRNKEFLTSEYFQTLSRYNTAHVLNAWTRMPPLAEQIALPGVFTADFTVVRGLLRHGRTYEQAVRLFEPYRHIQQPDPRTRSALEDIARHSITTGRAAYLFINNRLEGNAPETIDAVVSTLEAP